MSTAIVVRVGRGQAELAADVLWSLGVMAVEERVTNDAEVVELWSSVGESSEDVERAVGLLAARWPTRCEVVDPMISESWREFAEPVRLDDELTIIPEWWSGALPPGSAVVTIEPGTSFGLGDHPTTVLTARAMRRHVRPGVTVADIGCGSGVLSVIAALGGARVEAIDISDAAVRATRHNAARNGVAHHIAVSTTPCAECVGPFDVVVANVLAPELIAMANDLRRITAVGGVLIVSGVLDGRHAHVVAALSPMTVSRTDTADGWAAVCLRHPLARA